MRNPLTSITGTYTNKNLVAGPGRLTIKMLLSGSPGKLDLWNVRVPGVHRRGDRTEDVDRGAAPAILASEKRRTDLDELRETVGVGASGPTGGNVWKHDRGRRFAPGGHSSGYRGRGQDRVATKSTS